MLFTKGEEHVHVFLANCGLLADCAHACTRVQACAGVCKHVLQHHGKHPVVLMSVTRTYSVNHVAELLDRSRRWVYVQMKSGALRYETIAGARRITEHELQRFMAAGGNDE